MRDLSSQTDACFSAAVAAIDAANAADPTSVEVRGERAPLALTHGRLAAAWVSELVGEDDHAVLLAARAHHLRRWEVPRSSFPEGRAGYLRWRREQKARHARDVGELLAGAGYEEAFVARVQALVRRDDLATDAGAQAVEDGACLAFLETQLDGLVDRLPAERLTEVIRKTAAKMSPAALAMVGQVPLSERAAAALAAAR